MEISNRQNQIVQLLLDSQSFLTSQQIADFLQVSTRTVKDEIKGLLAVQEMLGLNVESIRGKGYMIKIASVEEWSKHQNVFTSVVDLNTQNNRIRIILQRLLISDDFTKLRDLAAELSISLSTLNKDLVFVKTMLEEEGLALKGTSNRGVMIIGTEQKIRKTLAKYLDLDLFSIESYNRLLKTNMFSYDEIKYLSQRFVDILHEYNMDVLGLNITNLLIHIIISIYRIKSGYTIQHIHVHEDRKLVEFEIANKIAWVIQDKFNIALPTEEIEYLGFCLMGKGVRRKQEVKEVKELITKIYKLINDNFNIVLDEEDDYSNALYFHTLALKDRLDYGIVVDGTITEMVRQRFVLAYEMAIIYQHEFYAHYHVELNDIEVCYVAVHFGAMIENQKLKEFLPKLIIVTEARTGNALLLKNEIISKFGHLINAVGIYSPYELSKVDITKIEYILSTETLNLTIQKSYLVIPINLDSKALNKISTYIQNKSIIFEIFKKNLFYIREMEDLNELLLSCAKDFEKLGYIENSQEFYQQTLEREKLQSTRFSYSLALPHPLVALSKISFISVIVLKRDMLWFDGQKVRLILYIGINPKDKKRINEIFEILSEISSNQQLIKELANVESHQLFMKKLNEHLETPRRK